MEQQIPLVVAMCTIAFILIGVSSLLLSFIMLRKLDALNKELTSYLSFEVRRLDKRIDDVTRHTTLNLESIKHTLAGFKP